MPPQNKDLHCVVISTMLEGGSEPFPVLQVDSRLIKVNGKDAVLEKAAEITEVSWYTSATTFAG